MRLVRANSTPIESYNEGLVVFLYDDASSEQIREANPSVLEGFGEADAIDPKLGDLAAAGALVAFEIQGDGDLCIELAVGEPLTEAEVALGGWDLPVTVTRLALPSGDLHVECYNTLQFDEYLEEGEEGARVLVPGGEYTLSLYHRDVLGGGIGDDEDAEDDEDVEAEYAWHMIVLTPNEGAPPRVPGPMLRFPMRAGGQSSEGDLS